VVVVGSTRRRWRAVGMARAPLGERERSPDAEHREREAAGGADPRVAPVEAAVGGDDADDRDRLRLRVRGGAGVELGSRGGCRWGERPEREREGGGRPDPLVGGHVELPPGVLPIARVRSGQREPCSWAVKERLEAVRDR
jgi:hypothetical protein